MPIGNITQSVSVIPAPPHRGVEVQTVFVTKQEDFQDHLQGTTVTELNTLKDQLNTRIGEINSTVATMNRYVNDTFTGASTATTKAGEASTSATAALDSRNQANTFATNSSISATKASQWAENNYNAAVETGKYSAKHWATVAQNATSGKMDKVTSTDNAIVRFNGTTGDVQNSNITVDDIGNIGTGTQSFKGFGGSGFKNYIINGGFDIWQRGTSFLNIPSGLLFCADRWFLTRDGTGATVNINRGDWIPGSVETGIGKTSGSILEFQQTVAGTGCNYNTINQRLEGIQWSSQKTMTLSFNCSFGMSADTIKNISIRQNFGIGGSAFVDTYAATNVSVIAAWEFKSFTFTLPSISGKTIGANPSVEIIISLPLNKVFQFRLNKVQLELGSVATPFENRPYGLELSLCQRYFRSLGLNTSGYPIGAGGVNTGTAVDTTYALPIPMRRTPDLSVVGAYSDYSLTDGVSTYTPTSIALQDNATDCINIRSLYSGGTAGRSAKLMTTTANGGILLNAEL